MNRRYPFASAAPLFVLMLALGLAACSGSGRIRYDTPQEAYEKGLAFYEAEKYDRAIPFLQGAFDFGRTHEYADDAQLFLARAYRGNKQYLLAENEYTRFMQIYRSDPRVPEAEFERGMTLYERSPEYELDQTSTQQAIANFQLFMNRYPSHELVARAEAITNELRDKLALKQFEIGNLYERRKLYQSAAIAFLETFDRYPDTDWADDALLGAIRNYIAYSNQSIAARQPERLQLAIENYERLIQLFPESPLLKQAEALYDQAQRRINELINTSS